MATEFEQIFARLSQIIRENQGSLTIKDEPPNKISLIGGQHPKHKTPMLIAWAEVGKNYVSYHLMPVYGAPKLMDGFSEKLKSRMQGKACFNFKQSDEALFQELDRLTRDGLAAFRKFGYLR